MSIFDPTSWDDPFEDIADLGKTVVDGARDAAEAAVGVAEVIGDGIVDGALLVGEGVVTFGQDAAKWSVNAAGDAIEWTKTSYAEVAEWTESAAGLVANFSVDAYRSAYDAIKVVYNFLADYFTETLPTLGALDPKAREVAARLLSEPVARGIEALADAAGAVITFGIKLKAVGTLSVGIYACGDGWGFYVGSNFDNLASITSSAKLEAGVSAQVALLFGPVSRASGAKALKLGLGMKANPSKQATFSIGGVILMEATTPPLFLGVRYAMDLDLNIIKNDPKTQPAPDPSKLKWKVNVALPKPNGDFVTDAYNEVSGAVQEIGWEELATGVASQATHFDAALRAHADPAGADRLLNTALAASIAAFKPRYYGRVRTDGNKIVSGTSQGPLGLDIAGDRAVVQVVAGLTDPTCVSFEAVGEPPLYWCVQPNGEVKLIPYCQKNGEIKDIPDKESLAGTTFRMHRGKTGKGFSFSVADDPPQNPRYLVATRIFGGVVMPAPVFRAEYLQGTEAPQAADAVFHFDRPADMPEPASSILRPGGHLKVGEVKRSPNGLYSLILAPNGRLAVRRRGSTPLGSPTTWLAYEPGLIQDEIILWAWASPQPAAAAAYHAALTGDGHLVVRAGQDPSQAGATLWQSPVHGAPGPCFLAVTNQGVVTITQGTPEAPGEIVWSSFTGALHWPTRRRQVVLWCGAGYVSAALGGGVHDPVAIQPAAAQPVLVNTVRVGGWEVFELQDLCTGGVALRAQGRRYLGVEDGGLRVSCLEGKVTERERFIIEVVNGPHIRIKSALTGRYVRDKTTALGGLHADGVLGQAGIDINLIEVEHDLSAHSGRPVHLIARHSGKALEVPDGQTTNGLGLVQGRFTGGDHQKWILTYLGDGAFTLRNLATNLQADINGSQTVDGAIALQWPAHDGPNQRFALIPNAQGHYHLIARHSGRALTVEAGTQVSGGRIIQAGVNTGLLHQQWRIEFASPAKRGLGVFTPVQITSLDQLLSLEKIRLRSWKGDYLVRNNSGAGVTSAATPDLWRLVKVNLTTFALISKAGDGLHRPDSPAGVTTFTVGIGNEWSLEIEGAKIYLRSWKNDYLHRPDSPSGVTTWGRTIGSSWTVEAMMP